MKDTPSVNNRTMIFIDNAVEQRPVDFGRNIVSVNNHCHCNISTHRLSKHNDVDCEFNARPAEINPGIMATHPSLPDAFASPRTYKRYDEQIKQLCIQKIVIDKWSVRLVANNYHIPRKIIYMWLSKHPAWRGIHANDDFLSIQFHQQVVGVNRSLLHGHKGIDVPIDTLDESHRNARVKKNSSEIAEHIRPVPAGQNQSLASAPDQPIWRPW